MFHFIINPKSRTGKGIKVWEIVKKELDSRAIEYSSHFTHYEFHATKIAKDICKRYNGIKNIVVLGGDGTINEVLNGITSYEDIILGYIPSGSSNDLARSLGISKDPLDALSRILDTKYYKYLDYGVIDLPEKNTTKRFAVSTGMGFDAAISYEALTSKIKTVLNKIKLGKLTYVIIAIKQIINYKPVDGEIIVDHDKSFFYPNIFFVASMIHPYEGGGFAMAGKANPTDGKLSVCVIYNIHKLKALIILPAILFNMHTHIKGVQVFECDSLEIKTKEKLVIHTDGEFAGRLKTINVSCVKEGLRMIV